MLKNKKSSLTVFQGASSTGGLIKAYRENFEISQDDMAFACGISQANLSAIENNRRDVGSRTALRLASFMGLSPGVVLYPNGYDKEPEFIEVQKRKARLKNIAG